MEIATLGCGEQNQPGLRRGGFKRLYEIRFQGNGHLRGILGEGSATLYFRTAAGRENGPGFARPRSGEDFLEMLWCFVTSGIRRRGARTRCRHSDWLSLWLP